MTVPSEELRFAGEFEPATLDQWRRLALGVLRKSGLAGEDTPAEGVEDLLSVTTDDGIRIAPLYPAATPHEETGAPGLPPFVRGISGDPRWDVRQRHRDPDPVVTNAAILDDLANGVTSIWLDLGPEAIAPSDLGRVLDGAQLDIAPVVLDAGSPERTQAAAEALLRLADARGTAARGNLGVDPLGWAARTGPRVTPANGQGTAAGPRVTPANGQGTAQLAPGDPHGTAIGARLTPAAADVTAATTWAVRCSVDHPGLRAITVDATVYHEAGGSDAEELGAALGTGVAYLRALTDAGLDITDALSQLDFRYAASADQFLTIAKFRAARRLWARVAQECGVPEAGAQRQHAVTSGAMMTARDPWVNMLRTTLACFGAGIGGAGAVTVEPFDACLGLPDSFARRIARNTQSLLLDEAHLGTVLDPAGGSWYAERLTDELADAAWTWFRAIERAGGMAAALDSGLVAARLDETWSRRRENLARRRDVLVGVSEFANLTERLPVRRPAPRAPATGDGLPRHRYAEDFEALRARSDAHAATGGSRPTVTLVAVGPPSVSSARVSFATNLFAAGGVDTTTITVADTAGVEDAVQGTAPVACICSSDTVYQESAGAVSAALAKAGVRRIWLAGRGDYPAIDGNLYSGCDAVAVLQTTLHDLEVA